MHQTRSRQHAHHDPTRIAALAAGDLAERDRADALHLLDTCSECADLQRDLVALAGALRTLPRTAAVSRDFRIDPAQAEQLHNRSWLRTLLRPFAAQAAIRPIAGAFTTLGIAGLLVATILPSLIGAGSSAGAAAMPTVERDRSSISAAGASAGPAAMATDSGVEVAAGTAMPGNDGAQPPATTGSGASPGNESTAGPAATGGTAFGQPGASKGDGPDGDSVRELVAIRPSVNPVVVGSVALLVVGLSLYALRFAARRLR